MNEINTTEMKAAFEALYYGQKVWKSHNFEKLPSEVLTADRLCRQNTVVSLRSIGSLTEIELLKVAEIFDLSPEQITDTDLQEWVEALFSETAGYYIDGYTGTQMQYLCDYLRSISILIPFMGLSTDEILKRGWAVIREGETV